MKMTPSKRAKVGLSFFPGFVGFILGLSPLADPTNQTRGRAGLILLLAFAMWAILSFLLYSILDYIDPEKK